MHTHAHSSQDQEGGVHPYDRVLFGLKRGTLSQAIWMDLEDTVPMAKRQTPRDSAPVSFQAD